jgi:hypothetical protein
MQAQQGGHTRFELDIVAHCRKKHLTRGVVTWHV